MSVSTANNTAATSPQPETAPRAKILVVDRGASNLGNLQAILEDLGQEIVTANSGDEALSCLSNSDFAVILLDVNVPGMDSFETAALMRDQERSRRTPIVFIVTRKDEERLFRGHRSGVIDFLYRPISRAVLLSKVSMYVDLRLKSDLLESQARAALARARELEQLVEQRTRAEAQILALNAELEKRVHDRTRELSRSNEDLRQFAYAASHDLKEPMRTIASYSQLLAHRFGDVLDDEGREFLGYVVEGVRRMDALLSDLLMYSQHLGAQPPVFQYVDAEAVLMAVLMNLQASIKENDAKVSHDALPSEVTSDFAQLSLVFQNLISNAIKYRRGEPPEIRLWAEDGDEEWVFHVRDNGLGIEPSFLDQIFRPFKRLHGHEFPGTGMGLAISKKIVERHGGRIWVESEPGQGSTFSFSIPK
jgi:two-component system sensor histidine kinase/response regulator